MKQQNSDEMPILCDVRSGDAVRAGRRDEQWGTPAAGSAAEPQKWGNTMSEQNDKVTCPYCGASVRVTGTSRAVLCPVCRKSFAKPTMQKKATDLFRDGETDDEFRDTMKKVTKEAGFEEYADNAGAALDDER